MQIHEMVAKLTAAGYAEETARELTVFALQSRPANGWQFFEPNPATTITKIEVTRIFALVSINPDEIKPPTWCLEMAS